MKKNTGDKSAARGIGNEIDQYLARVPEPARSTLSRVRAAIRAAAPPGAVEAISYRIPAFKLNGPLLGFAAFPKHCSLFVFSGTLLDSFAADLKDYSISKGAIRFPLDKPLPPALIKKLMRAKLDEHTARP
jgi:uncharacterized protein YdhG (YjbR/CyaY superfamily)